MKNLAGHQGSTRSLLDEAIVLERKCGARRGQHFFCKGPGGNTLGLTDHMVSDATTELYCHSTKVSMSFKSHVVTEYFYLSKQFPSNRKNV